MDAKLRTSLWVAIYGVVMLAAGLAVAWTPLRNAGVIFLVCAPSAWLIAMRREKESS